MMNRLRRRLLSEARAKQQEAERAVHEYLSEIGRGGGKQGGKATGRKGFAAISQGRFREICAKAKVARREKARERQRRHAQ
ncbi:MAG TPA: hypothetical protein VEU11_04175 [Terriglobales bacterium]|nr:hypothetical protein [Terriglobales bacterium]